MVRAAAVLTWVALWVALGLVLLPLSPGRFVLAELLVVLVVVFLDDAC